MSDLGGSRRARLLGSVSALCLGLAGVLGATGSAEAVFDRFVLVQPIVVCDDAGNNCAPVNYFHAGAARALEQAGLLPIFLPLSQFNNTALLNSNNGPSDFDDTDGGSLDALTINMWFTGLNSIVNCGGTAAIGCASTPGKQIVIDAQSLLNEAAGNGNDPYHRTIAHEIGHNFGLPHVTGMGFEGNLLEVPATVDRSGAYDEIGVDRFLLDANQINTIRGDGKAQTASDCNGDGGDNNIDVATGSACLNIFAAGGDDVITLNFGAGVLQNVQGEAGNDLIGVLNGSIVGDNVSGGSGHDLILIGGIVLDNVLGNSGNDFIQVLSTGQVIFNADGGSGDDTITIAAETRNVFGGTGSDSITLNSGAFVPGSVYGDDNDGDESDDGGDLIVMNGGSVGGNVDGEGGGDVIRILGGSVGGSVLGGGGDDVIETAEPATVTVDVDGESGDDIITIASDPLNVLGGTGNDVITLNNGAEAMNVFGDDNDGDESDDGDDVIVMNGGTVANVLDAEGGDDVIGINGGSVFEVDGGGGDDVFNIAGGLVGATVFGEAGDDFFNLTGGSIGGSLDGGSGADRFLLSGGDVTQLIRGGSGSDEILLTGSVIGGDVFGDEDADLIVMTAGSVNNIFGGSEDDLIQVLGGAVFGGVFGEAGNDEILTAEPGTVLGDVDGGSGNDVIAIASDPLDVLGGTGDDVINIVPGAFVAGSVFGDDDDGDESDDGHDVINLSGGLVLAHVLGQGGDDTITLSGATVNGSIFGNGGHDTIVITGGSVGVSVEGGAGDDVAVWSGGTIAAGGTFAMGSGSDTLDVLSVNAGGSAVFAPPMVLDGGDDASSADGQVDSLNLYGVDQTLPELLNWEFIDLLAASNAAMAPGQIIETELFFIEHGSRLFASSGLGGASYVIDGDLLNEGLLDMAGGVPAYDSFTVTGVYTGDPGQFRIDAFLGGAGSPSDILIVGGATAGRTVLEVFDSNPGAGAYNPDGIPVVDVSGGATSADHFVLANGFTGLTGPIDKGLFFYDLALRADNVHVLIGVPDLEVFQLGRVAGQAQSAWHRTAGVWLDRTADLRAFHDGSAAPGSRGPVSPGFWMRGVGSVADREESVSFTLHNKTYDWNLSYGQNIYGAFAGGDWAWNAGQGSGVLGAFVGYTGWDSQFGQQSANGGFGTVEANGVSFGFYATYVNAGFFLDGAFKADLPEIEMSFPGLEPVGPSAATTDSASLGGVLDAGYRHKFGFNWYVEGLGTLAYVDTEIDPADLAGSTVEFGGDQSFRGRLGLGLGGTFAAGEVATLVSRLSLSAWQEFDGRNGTLLLSPGGDPLNIRDDLGGTYGEVSLLVDVFGNQRGLSFFVKSDYRFGEDSSEFAGSLGLRYQ